MKAKASWHKGLQFIATSDSNRSMVLDSAKINLGGFDSAVSPFELILVGLAGCTGMDVISILQKKRQNVTAFEVNVEGERAKEFPKVLTKIHVEFIVTGKNINEAAVKKAIELSENVYCGVSAMLKKTAEMTSSYKIIQEE